MTPEKLCRTCDEVKPRSEFYWNSSTSKYASACKECTRAKRRAYRQRNLVAIRARDKARESNPNRRTGHWRNTYRQRIEKFGLTPIYGVGDQEVTHEAVIARYGDGCHYGYNDICKGGFTVLDHYLPVSFGGPHTMDNVRPACRPCNESRYYRGLRWTDPDTPARAA